MDPTKALQAQVNIRREAQRLQDVRKNAASHTYDQGYKKWESFDVDRALAEVDGQATTTGVSPDQDPKAADAPIQASFPGAKLSSGPVTPASIVPSDLSFPQTTSASSRHGAFPDADPVEAKPRDVTERERGNDYYKKGDFAQAVKFYTRAIGFNPRSAVAYSNRAMALLKLKDFTAADADCCSALELDPTHVKSLTRRATARNALGRHRAAFVDFALVRELEPQNRQAIAELARTRELVRSSARRAPRTRVSVTRVSSQEASSHPLDENNQSVANETQPATTIKSSPRDIVPKPQETLRPTQDKDDSNTGRNDCDDGVTARASTNISSVSNDEALPVKTIGTVSAMSETLNPTRPSEKPESDFDTQSTPASSSTKPPHATTETETNLIAVVEGELEAEAEAGVAPVRISHVVARLPSRAPQSMYEFERVWKELREKPSLRGELLVDLLGASGMRRLFGRAAPEADTLSEMVQGLCAFVSETSEAAEHLAVANAIAEIPSVDMSIMFLTKKERAALADALSQAGLQSSKLARIMS
ncbi:Peptidyl-prolyl cis-trans isomerase FKBP4 [Hondaea fermentalgiana]|uniref:RNA polymerase II-associated protein 3 n=1 Tax=Hondaea fermentalgiana TaxID=2315210 RepID=A0A2R5G9G5_9STRA|nr:Peptidyl-prolyl cis-trans isomerase FKBP4 [Hondaea fermentalgiana]|eukprot:GBG26959.1 Peptidyl-prolyl cis-trans isomerase FKBP4 [Hondaea fermentalgiana]